MMPSRIRRGGKKEIKGGKKTCNEGRGTHHHLSDVRLVPAEKKKDTQQKKNKKKKKKWEFILPGKEGESPPSVRQKRGMSKDSLWGSQGRAFLRVLGRKKGGDIGKSMRSKKERSRFDPAVGGAFGRGGKLMRA